MFCGWFDQRDIVLAHGTKLRGNGDSGCSAADNDGAEMTIL
jgi:hypothetical protein